MQDFTTFVRMTALGLMTLLVVCLVCAHSALGWLMDHGAAGPALFALAAALVGLLLEPLVKHHPLPSEVGSVYRQVSHLVETELDSVDADARGEWIRNAMLDSEWRHALVDLLSKSVYEFAIWTFPGTDTYMRRVNQQIRLAYFFLSVYYVYVGGICLAATAFIIRNLIMPPVPGILRAVASDESLARANRELLLGSSDMNAAAVVILGCALAGFVPARYYYFTGIVTLRTELYSRHVVICQHSDLIRGAVRNLLANESMFREFVANVEPLRRMNMRQRRQLYWLAWRSGRNGGR